MAKVGFDYYSVDTNRYQDIKIKRLKKDFGCAGLSVYDYVLCEIYRVKGCFLQWDDMTAFDVADYFGLKETLVNEIINYCCNVGLFDKAVLTSESVITSSSIQARFLKWSKLAKRFDIEIPEKYYVILEKTPKLPEKRGIIQEEKPHKGKESKETERKGKESVFEHDPDFEKLILGFFGFNEIKHFQNFKKFRSACVCCDLRGEYDYFKTQCENYKIFTEMIGLRYKHTFDNFLGKQENLYEDGVWNKENWELKISEEKEKSSGKKESNRGPIAVIEAFSQNMLIKTNR